MDPARRVTITIYAPGATMTLPSVDPSTARNMAEDFEHGRMIVYGGSDGVTYWIRTTEVVAFKTEEFLP